MTKWKNKTRGGHKVRVICEDARGGCPIVTLTEQPDLTYEMCRQLHADGRLRKDNETEFDLLPEEIHIWVNVYQYPDGAISIHPHESRKAADSEPAPAVGGNKISCFEMVIEPGNGLPTVTSELRPCPCCGKQPDWSPDTSVLRHICDDHNQKDWVKWEMYDKTYDVSCRHWNLFVDEKNS